MEKRKRYTVEQFIFALRSFSELHFLRQDVLDKAALADLIKSLEEAFNLEGQFQPEFNAPVLAAFCTLVRNAAVIKMDDTESIESYCVRVCAKYRLAQREKMRQYFGDSFLSEKRINQVRKQIFYKIDKRTRDKIEKSIKESKRLYG